MWAHTSQSSWNTNWIYHFIPSDSNTNDLIQNFSYKSLYWHPILQGKGNRCTFPVSLESLYNGSCAFHPRVPVQTLSPQCSSQAPAQLNHPAPHESPAQGRWVAGLWTTDLLSLMLQLGSSCCRSATSSATASVLGQVRIEHICSKYSLDPCGPRWTSLSHSTSFHSSWESQWAFWHPVGHWLLLFLH